MGQLKAKGFEITANAQDADTIVVNTCGFIARQERIIELFLKRQIWKKTASKRLVVAGCLVERYRMTKLKCRKLTHSSVPAR